MEARVKNFRRGRNTKYDKQIIVETDEINEKDEAKEHVGKKAVYTTESGKKIIGKVTSPHGNSGALRLRFRKGLPGQIIGSKIEIKE